MTHTAAWREFETGDSLVMKLVRVLVILGGFFVLGSTGMLRLSWPQQAVLGLLMVLIGVWMDRSSRSYLVTLTLMLASLFSTFRYGYWRIATVVEFFQALFKLG